MRGVLTTYTLTLRRDADEAETLFEPVLCRTPSEALPHARGLLDRNPTFDRAEVSFGDDVLFTLRRTPA